MKKQPLRNTSFVYKAMASLKDNNITLLFIIVFISYFSSFHFYFIYFFIKWTYLSLFFLLEFNGTYRFDDSDSFCEDGTSTGHPVTMELSIVDFDLDKVTCDVVEAVSDSCSDWCSDEGSVPGWLSDIWCGRCREEIVASKFRSDSKLTGLTLTR